MATCADLQTEWAHLVVRSLVQAGVRNAILCPGSRCAPFTIAALEQSELRCVSALDERSAAHFALGQARASGCPSLVVCTSGSAPANCFSAVVEASEAGVPLIVLSADRPAELLRCGSNQTTDQAHLFGRHVRLFTQLAEPRNDKRSLWAAKRAVVRSVNASLGSPPGPVHINAPVRKPLEPRPAVESEVSAHARVEAISGQTLVAAYAKKQVDPRAVEQLAHAFAHAARPAMIFGPALPSEAADMGHVVALASRAGIVVVAESTSQLRCDPLAQTTIGAFDTIWRTTLRGSPLVPDFVLQVGADPISGGWDKLRRTHTIRCATAHAWKWIDPSGSADIVVETTPRDLIAALNGAELAGSRNDTVFASDLRRADKVVWAIADELLEEAGDQLGEAQTARLVRSEAPEKSTLVLGNSLPIRNFDIWVPPGGSSLRVYCQRGVSGIDGVVSAAAGVGSCVEGPTTLFVGDVSFLADINGMQLAANLCNPFVIVVVNNCGGRIFEQLPIARLGRADWLRYFTTPHRANMRSAASLYGCTFVAVRTVSALRASLKQAYRDNQCTVIEAVVPPHGSSEQNRVLCERVKQHLREKGL